MPGPVGGYDERHMKMRLSLALTLLLAGTAGAQTTGLTVWGGAGTEAYIAPGLTLGLSAPVGQIAGLNAELRGSASVYLLPLPDVTGPLSTINADLLFSGNSGNVNLYGGPSVGYAVGAVAGGRDRRAARAVRRRQRGLVQRGPLPRHV
ncbi:hypothetical protein [Deinococcus multiflagellatus]|uniref:Uncharacterized protein n=1 Tax=Deinococcus multiflagellatus TaxID=1656887 RepID=A0ABW1ZII1_9DEIO